MQTLPTSKIRLNRPLSTFASKGRLLNADDCYTWICKRNGLVGWTYNYNHICGLLEHFQKLICGTGRTSKKVRIANNTHMKCYIDKKCMLVTSFNLTHPTINDLGIEIVDIALCNYMRIIFNKHWKELE